ncbi:MAG: hypothetical protein NTX03_00960 [Bacteroidetes bacterium]|nr:hypothetical protein [Bacteroidota bacterium]
MKNPSLKNHVFILFFCILALASCAKKGCTDPDSINYDPTAKKDDGNCAYVGKLIFWWQKPFADSCMKHGYSYTDLYVNSFSQGKLAVGLQYWTPDQKPNCDEHGTITYKIDMGKEKSKQIFIQYKLGATTFSNYYPITAKCKQYKLTW